MDIDTLSERTRKMRRALLMTSLATFVMLTYDVKIKSVTGQGIVFEVQSHALPVILLCVTLYFIVSFSWYAWEDKENWPSALPIEIAHIDAIESKLNKLNSWFEKVIESVILSHSIPSIKENEIKTLLFKLVFAKDKAKATENLRSILSDSLKDEQLTNAVIGLTSLLDPQIKDIQAIEVEKRHWDETRQRYHKKRSFFFWGVEIALPIVLGIASVASLAYEIYVLNHLT